MYVIWFRLGGGLWGFLIISGLDLMGCFSAVLDWLDSDRLIRRDRLLKLEITVACNSARLAQIEASLIYIERGQERLDTIQDDLRGEVSCLSDNIDYFREEGRSFFQLVKDDLCIGQEEDE